MQEEDPELLENTGFAVIPQPADAKGATNTQAIGLGYAVAINAKLADDPEKLAAAVDLAEYVNRAGFLTVLCRKLCVTGSCKSR